MLWSSTKSPIFTKGGNSFLLNPKVNLSPQADVEGLDEGTDLVLKYEVETKPIPEIGDYSKIEVVKEEAQLEEAEVDQYIETEREKNKIIKNVEDREAVEGDTAVIDFEGFKDGVAFEGGKADNYDLKLGSNTFDN